ncbi:TadE/TadG family type IV pilus assembly protein [Aurantimonas sp. Leaf443]|uniref:TadE/TadG family type IV pilus assembly protein n=1 Tax=Aurantimonas sp. Leaf443 TaxID=1736378 RepID=UPI0006FDE7FC|nr:TadE/TadG family type IV pilus assembly protein [Aurantimonas sp. Leaf443]KQT82518.1 pilus assembly protein TadG [Aurantimonas sp. Leaf443]
MRPSALLLRRLVGETRGATAIEFALVALPLFIILFAIFEIAILFFIYASLDGSLVRAARLIRTGEAAAAGLNISQFKEKICQGLQLSFGCPQNLRVKVDIVSDLMAVAGTQPVTNGSFSIQESFDIGKGGDYIIVQAFLPWSRLADLYSLSSVRTAQDEYVIVSSTIFRNEAF